jgi:hypothetical protein
MWTHLAHVRGEWGGGSCEHGNEPLCYITGGEILNELNDC